MKPKIAIVWFPGTNCENETKVACDAAGMDADIVRWNQRKIEKYNGFIFPGGWSYEDRIRAGVIASKDPIMGLIRKQGKAILGICNGCQILVEAGLIPGLKKRPEMALAPNVNPIVTGYYCTWTRVKNTGKKNAFNIFYSENEIIEMPIAHGEGRFATKDAALLRELEKNGQIAFRYCDKNGKEDGFPVNPNGSLSSIAGITNKEGNILAMMPHPERAFFNKQLPGRKMKNFEDAMSFAKAAKIFESMREYIKND